MQMSDWLGAVNVHVTLAHRIFLKRRRKEKKKEEKKKKKGFNHCMPGKRKI